MSARKREKRDRRGEVWLCAQGLADDLLERLAERGAPAALLPGRDSLVRGLLPHAKDLIRARRRFGGASWAYHEALGDLTRTSRMTESLLDKRARKIARNLPRIRSRIEATVPFTGAGCEGLVDEAGGRYEAAREVA